MVQNIVNPNTVGPNPDNSLNPAYGPAPSSCDVIRPHRSRSAAAYSDQTFPWTICRSVRRSVCASVLRFVQCIVAKKDRIRKPFGIVGRTGPGMRQVVGFGDRSTERGTFGSEFWGSPL